MLEKYRCYSCETQYDELPLTGHCRECGGNLHRFLVNDEPELDLDLKPDIEPESDLEPEADLDLEPEPESKKNRFPFILKISWLVVGIGSIIYLGCASFHHLSDNTSLPINVLIVLNVTILFIAIYFIIWCHNYYLTHKKLFFKQNSDKLSS